MKKKAKWSMLILLFGMFSLLLGCYPSKFDTVDDWDISVTMKHPDFNSFNIKTYALVDSVAHGDKDKPTTKFDETILASVKKNVDQLGWTSAAIADADVVIFCSAANTNVYSYWYDYWYPYWDYYYPYYPYYPWSYGGVSYDYSEGTVCIQMNSTAAEESGKSPVLWVGIIDGVLNDTNVSIEKRIETGVNQCFDDSFGEN